MTKTALLYSLPCVVTLATGAFAEVPHVATDMAITQSLVAQVMGDLGTPAVLLAPGASPHSYQMRPSEARALDQADLLIWIGPELSPWLERAAQANAGKRTDLQLLDVAGTHTRRFAGDGDEDEDEGHDHGSTGDDGLFLDPHAWLDPKNADTWLGAIAEALTKADPEHGAIYSANAAQARGRIDALDARISTALAPVRDKPFVVYHDAYGYFADHFGLQDAGSVSPGDAAEPGAAHLKALHAELAAKDVACAFPEAGHDPRLMARLIEGSPVRLGAALDPEGLSTPRGPMLYETTLETIGMAIAGCLSGK